MVRIFERQHPSLMSRSLTENFEAKRQNFIFSLRQGFHLNITITNNFVDNTAGLELNLNQFSF